MGGPRRHRVRWSRRHRVRCSRASATDPDPDAAAGTDLGRPAILVGAMVPTSKVAVHDIVVPADPAGRELLAKFFRALGDPTRLALLQFCVADERTGTECVAHVGLSQGRVSAHLACLVSCGMLSLRRQGRFAYYQVVDPRVVDLLACGQATVADHAAGVAACTRVEPAR